VYFRFNQQAALAALAVAVPLCGCTNGDLDLGSGWFSKPLDLVGRSGGYTYAQLGEEKRERPITANDLVDTNGGCPASTAPQTQPAPGNAAPKSAVTPDPFQLGGVVGIGMSECEVVSRLGHPAAVSLGASADTARTAILTFRGGPRPGVYRFVGGRLKEMDRLDEPTPPPQPPKKKPAKADKPPKGDST
jgi:hypothetical protein